MRDDLLALKTYADPIEAEMACEHLRSAGIDAELSNRSAASSLYGAGNPIMNLTLWVDAFRVDEARTLLTGIREDPAVDAASTGVRQEGMFRSDWNARERAAETVWRAAILGCFVPLLSWYGLWRLGDVVTSDLPLSPRGKRRAIIASVILLVPAIIWLVAILLMIRDVLP